MTYFSTKIQKYYGKCFNNVWPSNLHPKIYKAYTYSNTINSYALILAKESYVKKNLWIENKFKKYKQIVILKPILKNKK